MNVLSSQNDPGTGSRQTCPDSRLRAIDKVHAVFTSLTKYINAKTIYSKNNPTAKKFAEAFYRSVREYFETEKELQLTIEQYQLKWRDEIVYDNRQKNESIAFLFYKDGVGEITILASVTPDELDRFVDLIKKEIYDPSVHLDIVNRLWEADFKNIFYRVFDECPDGMSGDGQGSGSNNPEHPLCVDDHPDISKLQEYLDENTNKIEDSFQSIGAYFTDAIERNYPALTTPQKELCIQKTLESFFNIDTEKLRSWQDEFFAVSARDKLLWLLDIMIDFTQMRSDPPIARDILDMTNRLVRNIMEEGKITSLIALLNMQKKLALSTETSFDFQTLPERIEQELTNNSFLTTLGKIGNRSQSEIRQLLVFFQMLGEKSLPGLLELIRNLKDPLMSKESCDLLLDLAGNDITRIVDDLDLDELQQAKNAIYLLHKAKTDEVSPVIKRLLCSSHVEVRELLTEYLLCVGNEEAALLLSNLFEDKDMRVRMKALIVAEEFPHPIIVDKVTALCFDTNNSSKYMDELERMFRAAGKLAGVKILGLVKQRMRKRKWLSFRKSQDKNDKLLAIAALRHIPGEESLNMLRELADDGDGFVKNKALYALRTMQTNKKAGSEDQLSTVGREAE